MYQYNNLNFDSKAELAFYIYCKDQSLPIQKCSKKFEYTFEGKKHFYFPDFEIDDKLHEIKGQHFLKEDDT